jgi:DNA-directed RNA polymerase subunit RPC12/RpoP
LQQQPKIAKTALLCSLRDRPLFYEDSPFLSSCAVDANRSFTLECNRADSAIGLTNVSTMKFKCPHCGQKLEAEPEWAGLSIDCPTCSQSITIPAPGEAPPTSAPEPPVEPEPVEVPSVQKQATTPTDTPDIPPAAPIARALPVQSKAPLSPALEKPDAPTVVESAAKTPPVPEQTTPPAKKPDEQAAVRKSPEPPNPEVLAQAPATSGDAGPTRPSFFFRPPSASAAEKAKNEELLTPEEIAQRRRRRRLWIGLALLVTLGAVGALTARPAVRAVKGWQSRRLAAEALRLIDQQQWKEAQDKVQDAYQLRSNEPDAIRAAAILLTRVGHAREAKNFWQQLEALRPLSPAEHRDFAAAELGLDELDAAATHLHAAVPPGQEGAPADWRLELQLAARRRDHPRTLALAQKIAASPAADERQRLDATLLLLGLGLPEAAPAAWETVLKIARGKTPESLEALELLARQSGRAATVSRAGKSEEKPLLPPAEVSALLEAHPLARIQHRLLALDLRLAEDPSQREAFIAQAIEKFSGDDEDLAGLSAWLYGKGEFARALEVNPIAKAVRSRALFLQYLDTLGALGRWQEIEDAIEGHKFSLDPMIEQMYLARCSAQLGQPQASELRWNAAIAAAGANPDKLMTVGAYAQKNGAPVPAEVALRAALKAAPDSRPLHEALLAFLQQQGRTAPVRDALADMAARWPQDAAVRNDRAYLDALLGENLPAARDAARQLVQANPASLPHRVTLALAEFRLGHALTALDAFKGMDPIHAASQPRQVAVYAAVLWETGYNADARRAAQLIDPARLLPEERELLRPIGRRKEEG